MSIEISPGWYVDPEDSSQYRYWNGNEWTGSTAKNDKPVEEQVGNSSSPPTNEEALLEKKADVTKELIQSVSLYNGRLSFEININELDTTSKYFLNSNLGHSNRDINFIYRNKYFDYKLQRSLDYKVKFKQLSDSVLEIEINLGENVVSQNYVTRSNNELYDYKEICKNLLFKLTNHPNAINKHIKKLQSTNLNIGKWLNSPIYKDWIGISWLALTVLAWLPAAYRVVDSGGPFFTAPDIISGLIDGAVYPLSLFILFVIPVLVIRKIYWKYSGKEVLTNTDFSIIVVFIILIAALVGFLFYQNRQAEIALAKSKLTSVCVESVESEVDSFGCADYPNVYFSVCLPYGRAEAYVVLEDSFPDLSVNKFYANDCPLDRPNYFSFSGSGVMDVLGGDYRVTVNNFSSKDVAEYGNYFSIPRELREIYWVKIVVK